MYKIEFTERGYRDLKKITPEVRKRIIDKIAFFSTQENPLSFAEYLINFAIGQYRFRIGDYRVICDVEEEVIVILRVGNRREIYK